MNGKLLTEIDNKIYDYILSMPEGLDDVVSYIVNDLEGIIISIESQYEAILSPGVITSYKVHYYIKEEKNDNR